MTDTRVYVILAGNPDQRPFRTSARATRMAADFAQRPSQANNIWFYLNESEECAPNEREPTDSDLDYEMGRTSWEYSCRNLLDLKRCCRRQAGHVGRCASGFGVNRVRWHSEENSLD